MSSALAEEDLATRDSSASNQPVATASESQNIAAAPTSGQDFDQPPSPAQTPAVPTNVRNIVILGAGFAGLSAAHYFMRHIYPSLKSDQSFSYRLVLIDQSTHFWWHISAPRALVSTKLMQHDKVFFPLADGFKQYGSDKDILDIKQAQPTFIDLESRKVNIKDMNEDTGGAEANDPGLVESIPYHALIIATGTTTPTAATSLHGTHTETQRALEDMNKRLARASSVIIAGGGPIGVETAGEVGEALNGNNSSLKKAKVKITLIAGSTKLLPVLSEKLSKKAAKYLEKVGVEVKYGEKVTKVDFDANEEGKTTVTLSNSETISADVYIPAIGAKPNTSYLPAELKDERGYVKSASNDGSGSSHSPDTLRVDQAGERVYVLGDVGAYTRGGVLDLYKATPVLGNNLAMDLGVRKTEKQHRSDESETQLVPVGSKNGVGAFKGLGMPGIAVRQVKGKDFMLGYIKKVFAGEQYKKP
ncbi:MAG: hypothetical protein Q9159_002838 [Coniocarpon cinnabarinum]